MTKVPVRKGISPIVAIATLGAAFSFGLATARAGDNVTEDQIVQALVPPNKPLTRGLSVSQTSLPSVQALGRALTNPDLKGSTFIVAGYTDAAGSEAYNQDLSERRADSIKRYLMSNHHIASGDLVTVGYGKNKLKEPSRPLAEINRRVQVVNMENKTTALSQ